jgi:hypothetical protein
MRKKEPQLKDLFFKDVTQHHAREMLDLLQLRGEYEVLDAERNKEVLVRRRESDQVLRVRLGGKVYLFHLEFISHYSRREVRKAYGFGGALTAKHNCDVITVLVVLKPPARPRTALGYYEIAPLGDALNQHGFAVIDISALRDRIMSGEKGLIGLAPILPEISKRVDKKLLARQRELIRSVDDPKRRAELSLYTIAFNKPHFDVSFLQKYFQEVKHMSLYEELLSVPIFGDAFKRQTREAERKAAQEAWDKAWDEAWDKAWTEATAKATAKASVEGEKRGEKKGKTETLQGAVLQVLKTRFGPVNGQIERRLKALDEPRALKRAVQLAVTAPSLQEFKSKFPKPANAARKRVAAR